MAPRMHDGPSRREWAYQAWDFHHQHHHDHEDEHHHGERRPHEGPPWMGRGRGWRGDGPGIDDDLRHGARRLMGAIRAAGGSGDDARTAALGIIDDATRAVYRLLADGPRASNAPDAGAAHSPEPPTTPTSEA